jgi:hypothetical protein
MPLGAFKAAIMGVAGVSTGDVVLLDSQTASSSTILSFTSGIDSTYGEYIFKFYNINPETDNAQFGFQVNATDTTSYDEHITSTAFQAYEVETGGGNLGYHPGQDQAQGQAFQPFGESISNGADESLAGELHLFNPSSTTYVKHFYSRVNTYFASDYTMDEHVGGYINETTAIDDIQFKMSIGDWDGLIKMWGVK